MNLRMIGRPRLHNQNQQDQEDKTTRHQADQTEHVDEKKKSEWKLDVKLARIRFINMHSIIIKEYKPCSILDTFLHVQETKI